MKLNSKSLIKRYKDYPYSFLFDTIFITVVFFAVRFYQNIILKVANSLDPINLSDPNIYGPNAELFSYLMKGAIIKIGLSTFLLLLLIYSTFIITRLFIYKKINKNPITLKVYLQNQVWLILFVVLSIFSFTFLNHSEYISFLIVLPVILYFNTIFLVLQKYKSNLKDLIITTFKLGVNLHKFWRPLFAISLIFLHINIFSRIGFYSNILTTIFSVMLFATFWNYSRIHFVSAIKKHHK